MSTTTSPHRTERPRLPVAPPRAARRAAPRMVGDQLRPLLLAGFLLVVATAANLAGPALLGAAVDAATAGLGDRLLPLTLAFAGVTALGTTLAGYGTMRLAAAGERILERLRVKVFDRAMELPLRTVEEVGTGDLLSRVTSDVSTLTSTVRTVVPAVTIAGLELVLTAGALALLSPLLAATLLLAVPGTVFGTRWYLRRAPQLYALGRAAQAEVIDGVHETHDATRTVTAYGLGRQRRDHVQAQLDEAYDLDMHAARLRNVLRPSVQASQLVALAAAIAVGAWGVGQGWVTLGEVTAASLYLLRIGDPMLILLEQLDQLQEASAAFGRVVGVTELAPQRDRPPDPATPADASVTVGGLGFAYGDGPQVLHDVDLAVPAGSTLAVVGPSGAGKTTLAKLVAGIHDPTAGEVRLGGVPLVDIDPDRLRRHVLLVTQEQHVFSGPLAEDLRLADADADDERLWEVLRLVEAERWVRRLPESLATPVGDGNRRLTAVQAQQVALARLLLTDPDVVVLDEATASLDPAAARTLEAVVRRVLHGRTVLMVTHRLAAAAEADRVAVLVDGRVSEVGPHEQLLADGSGYASLWHAWHAER